MINRAVFWKLSNDPAITAIVGKRVYPHTHPPTTQPTYPLIVFSPAEAEPMGTTMTRHDVDIACIASSLAAARSLADAVRVALDDQRGTWGGVIVDRATFVSSNEQTERVANGIFWVVELTFSMALQE